MNRFHLALTALILAAAPSLADDKDKFIVHEWGTFSTFSGSDGKLMKFQPNDTDLPQFVHSRFRNTKGGYTDALVSLETPVLYFYTSRDRTVNVHVDFPKGIMTDWYPEASRPPTQQLRWDNLKLLANDKPTVPFERAGTRYYAAREVDAVYLQSAEPEAKREYERFLFYRGVGDFAMPFEVRALGSNRFAIKNSGKEAVPGHFLVSVKDKKVSFTSLGKLAAGGDETVELPAEISTVEKLGEAMAALLVKQGLYEKEAKAMVKTWNSSWFGEEGVRVLYLVAEPVTAELLPMTIDPKPDQTVRVLVGRHDLLTPEKEKDVDALVRKLNGDSNSESKQADAEMNKLGRYRYAAQVAAEKRQQR